MNADAIGGYLELELPRASAEYHQEALRFQSARSAFLALLDACRPPAVWMPWYICESIVEPLVTAQVPIKRYELDERMRVKSAALAEGEWLLYVNYFGISDEGVDDVLRRFPCNQVVIDNAQSFFAAPLECVGTLYSPRKFVGVPDGGYLVTRRPVHLPSTIDRGSAQRFSHLLARIDANAEAGYADYMRAEDCLKLQEPKRMSKLTQRLLQSVDYAKIGARRIANFDWLHNRLSPSNLFPINRPTTSVPLCYPYMGGPAGLRDKLIRMRIYTPNYWPEVVKLESAPAFERELASRTLFLPCDQRLSSAQLDDIADAVLDRRDQS